MQKILLPWGLLVLCGLSAFSWADPLKNDWGKQELILFDAAKNQTPNSTKQPGQLVLRKGLDRLQTADAGGLKKFSAKAQLEWVTQQQPEVISSRDFILSPDFSQVAQGWSNQGGGYFWSGQLGRQNTLNLNLSTAIANQPFKLADYDELWIDYKQFENANQCKMQLEFQGLLQPHDKKKPPKTVMWHTGYNFDLKVVGMLDASNAAFKAKDNFYLLRSTLGLAKDEDWSFIQNQKHTVVQRRMHLKMDNVHALEIAFAAGQGVERVNLLVSREDGHGGGELLEFAGLSPDSTLQDGRFGVHLNLRDALAKRFPRDWEENSKGTGKNSFYLKEVLLFFPEDAQTVAASKPVRSLALLGVAEKGVQEFRAISSQLVSINPSQPRGWENFSPRLTVDIRKLPFLGIVDFTQANLRLYSPEDTASCAIHINNIRAVNIYNNQVPAFAKNLEGWVQGRGGPFVRLLPEQGQVEQPGIVNFLPLSTFIVDENTRLKTLDYLSTGSQKVEINEKLLQINSSIPDFRILNEAGKDIALEHKQISINNGATLAFQGIEPTLSRDGDNLVLVGNSDSLEITWPMATRLFENTWFYFGLSEGAEQISTASLTAEFADGHQSVIYIEPNKPFRIDSGRAKLTKISLRLGFGAESFRIKLRELTLFSPKIVTYGEALMLPLPSAMSVKLKPILTKGTQRLVETGTGYVLGLFENEPVRFVTLLDKQLDWVQGFNLGYRFPLGYTEGNCPLNMQLNWTNGQTFHRFCPVRTEGSIFLPLANLIGAENKGRNLGVLKSIEWIVTQKVSGGREGNESFSLTFSAEGWAMVSAMDQIRLSPLIQAGKEVLYVDMTKLKNDFSDSYSKRFWLPLGPGALDNIAAMKGEILPLKHPLFALNKIVAEPKQPIDISYWVTLLDPPALTLNSPPRWPILLLWISAIALIWGAWKKGWWSTVGLGRILLGIWKVLFDLARITTQSQIRLLWRLLPWLNLMVGVLALGPGLWLAGRLGVSIQGGMLLSGLVLVLLGVYGHWRGGTSRIWHERGWFVLALSAGCAFWSLGNFGLQRDAALGLLPLIGALYALYKPLLLWWQDKRHLFLLVVWAALTLALYGTGLNLKMGNGMNYFFIFGGIAVMLVMKGVFLVAEPRFRKVFPNIANSIYGGAGSLYFSGAIVLLVSTAILFSLKLELLAKQLAVVVYYCLVVGTVLEIAALRRNQYDHSGGNPPNSHHP